MWYCSSLVLFFFSILPGLTSKQIPLIGLFTSDRYDNTTNRSSSILIDYTLHHLKSIQNLSTELSIQHSHADVPCDMAVGTKIIFDMIHRSPRPLAIFSGSCQIVASAIAETAGIFDMTIVWSICSSSFIDILHLASGLDHLFRNQFVIHRQKQISILDSNGSWWFDT